MKKIIVSVHQLYGSAHYREIEKNFGMSIPDKIHLYVSNELIGKMIQVQAIMAQYSLKTISFLSYHGVSTDLSYMELYDCHNQKIKMSQYHYLGQTWDTCNLSEFVLTCERTKGYKFRATTSYFNQHKEEVFETDFFEVAHDLVANPSQYSSGIFPI